MIVRDFVLPNGETVSDPDPSADVDTIRQMYAFQHPELNNAVAETKEADGRTTVNFVVKVGKKG